MSRPDDGHHSFLYISNPFKRIFPRRTNLSPMFLALLNAFEERLAVRLEKLKPKGRSNVCSLTWMRSAVESLSETHTDIKSLITDLQLPVSEWDSQWIRAYLDDSLKLLDICVALSSEISRLDQGLLFLRFALNSFLPSDGCPSKQQLQVAFNSLHDWSLQANLRSPRLANSFSIIRDLMTSFCPAKVKNSKKGEVLMRAIYGVKVHTVFTFGVFAALLSASDSLLMDLHISENVLWAKPFKELTDDVYGEIRSMVSCQSVTTLLKELEAVHTHVHKLQSIQPLLSCKMDIEGQEDLPNAGLKDVEDELQHCAVNLGDNVERFTQGLDSLTKQVRDFFQIVLNGRDALLYNLGEPSTIQESDVVMD